MSHGVGCRHDDTVMFKNLTVFNSPDNIRLLCNHKAALNPNTVNWLSKCEHLFYYILICKYLYAHIHTVAKKKKKIIWLSLNFKQMIYLRWESGNQPSWLIFAKQKSCSSNKHSMMRTVHVIFACVCVCACVIGVSFTCQFVQHSIALAIFSCMCG